jgi:hypothetical protein
MIYASLMLEKFPNKGLEFFLSICIQFVWLPLGVTPWAGQIMMSKIDFGKPRLSSSSWGVVDMELWMLCVSTPPSGNIGFGNVERQSRNSPPIAHTVKSRIYTQFSEA